MHARKSSLFSTIICVSFSLFFITTVFISGAKWLFVLFEIPKFSLSIVRFSSLLDFKNLLACVFFFGMLFVFCVCLYFMRFFWVGRRDEMDGNWEVFCFELFVLCGFDSVNGEEEVDGRRWK